MPAVSNLWNRAAPTGLMDALMECKTHGLLTWIKTNKHFMLLLLYIVSYFSIGIGVFAHLEDWTFTESFYFSIITVSTVGYGDYHPTSTGAKVFSAFHMTFGIALFTLILGSRFRTVTSQEVVLDNLQDILRKREGPPKPYWKYVLKRILRYGLIYCIMLACGILFYVFDLGYSFADALYLAVATGTSVGYGDVSPSQSAFSVENGLNEPSFGGMWFSIFYVTAFFLFVIHILGWVASQLYTHSVAFDVKSSMEGKLSAKVIDVLDKNCDGTVDKAEFLEAVLVANGVVSPSMIESINDRFIALDRDRNGHLSLGDIDAQRIMEGFQLNRQNPDLAESA